MPTRLHIVIFVRGSHGWVGEDEADQYLASYQKTFQRVVDALPERAGKTEILTVSG